MPRLPLQLVHRTIGSPRRAVLMLLPAVWALAGCAALLGPRTIEVPEARLQQAVARQFPLRSRFLDLLDIEVATPRVSLRPESNRLGTEVDLSIGERLLKTPYRGTLAFSYGLRYEPGDHTVRLTDLHVERAELREAAGPGGAAVQRQLDRAGGAVIEKLLGEPVVYTLSEKDLDAVQRQGYRPGDIRVRPGGLTITLLPGAAP